MNVVHFQILSIRHPELLVPGGRVRLCDRMPSTEPIPRDYTVFARLCPACRAVHKKYWGKRT